jgi:hypothetical protein
VSPSAMLRPQAVTGQVTLQQPQTRPQAIALQRPGGKKSVFRKPALQWSNNPVYLPRCPYSEICHTLRSSVTKYVCLNTFNAQTKSKNTRNKNDNTLRYLKSYSYLAARSNGIVYAYRHWSLCVVRYTLSWYRMVVFFKWGK